jgi:hypothetical protein
MMALPDDFTPGMYHARPAFSMPGLAGRRHLQFFEREAPGFGRLCLADAGVHRHKTQRIAFTAFKTPTRTLLPPTASKAGESNGRPNRRAFQRPAPSAKSGAHAFRRDRAILQAGIGMADAAAMK